MKQEGYNFPDEDVEVDAGGMQPLQKPGKEETDDDFEVEVIDDTPEQDRDREPGEPPEEVTEDELLSYSEKVRRRIQHFSKGYHDERRAKETALRERQELERIARQLVEENQRLKGDYGKSQTVLMQQAKRVVETEMAQAKAAYKQAYENGDSDKLVEAEEKLATARSKAQRLAAFEKNSLQNTNSGVQQPQRSQNPAPAQQKPASVPPDPKAQDWAKQNRWFGQDDEMTSFALGLHNKLVKDGVDPKSDTYYERLNARMREVFPNQFGSTGNKGSVVAPATRSTAPKKVKLTKSQVAIAKRLGVPLNIYAQKVAEQMRKEANG